MIALNFGDLVDVVVAVVDVFLDFRKFVDRNAHPFEQFRANKSTFHNAYPKNTNKKHTFTLDTFTEQMKIYFNEIIECVIPALFARTTKTIKGFL